MSNVEPPKLWLQAMRFWRCARTIRHGYIDQASNMRKQMTKQEKLDEIDFWLQGHNPHPKIMKRYEELRAEVLGDKEYPANESATQIKTAS